MTISQDPKIDDFKQARVQENGTSYSGYPIPKNTDLHAVFTKLDEVERTLRLIGYRMQCQVEPDSTSSLRHWSI